MSNETEDDYVEMVRGLSLKELQWFDSLTAAYKALKELSEDAYHGRLTADKVLAMGAETMLDSLFNISNYAGHHSSHSNNVLQTFATWVSEGGHRRPERPLEPRSVSRETNPLPPVDDLI